MIQPHHVQVDKYLSKKVFTEVPRSENSQKMKIRYNIEKQIGEQFDAYDIYDMYVDMANAFNSLIKLLPTDLLSKDGKEQETIEMIKPIEKFLFRQQVIKDIIIANKENKENKNILPPDSETK